nr:protein FAR1-related sequence 5 [Tanacetum cinerariifolium]
MLPDLAEICVKIYDETDFKEKLNKILWNMYIGPKEFEHWTKNLIPTALRNKRNIYGEKNVVVENFANEATSIVDYCVHLFSKDEPRLGAFVEKLKSLKKDVEAGCPNPPSKSKTDNLEQLVGVLKPPVVEVNNPTVGSTKGQKMLRIKRGKENAIEKNLKGKNSCSLCGGTDHNKRTCPGRFEVEDEVVLQKKVKASKSDTIYDTTKGILDYQLKPQNVMETTVSPMVS